MEDWEEPELIGVTQIKVAEAIVRGGAGSRGKAIAALIAATFVGFLALQAFGGPEEPNPDSAVNEVTGEDAQPDSTDSSAQSTTTTSRPRRTTTTQPQVVIAGEPLFDHDTGWDIFLGNDGMELTRLSLDDGSYEEFRRGYWPVSVVGDVLLLTGNSDRIRWLPLSELDKAPESLPGTMNPGFYGSYRLPEGGNETQVWMPGGDWDSQTWQLWDFSGTPELVREIEAVSNNFGPLSHHPTIVASPSGGIYQGEIGNLERVADGRLLAVNAVHVVVERCDDPFDCEVVWLHRDTFELDTSVVPPPTVNSNFFWGMVESPNGEWLFVPDFQTGRSILWNLKSGDTLLELFAESGSFSPDSRYAAGVFSNGRLAIVDLETGELAEWDLPGGNHFYGGILFVPAP